MPGPESSTLKYAVGERTEIEQSFGSRLFRRCFRFRQYEELIRESRRACRGAVHGLDLLVHIARQLAAKQELEMHLQRGQRGAQLVSGVGEKSLLDRVRITQL